VEVCTACADTVLHPDFTVLHPAALSANSLT
jgi:hypothetical protein